MNSFDDDRPMVLGCGRALLRNRVAAAAAVAASNPEGHNQYTGVHTAIATDANGLPAGKQKVDMTGGDQAVYKGKTYYQTGKEGASLGNAHPTRMNGYTGPGTRAPEGKAMREYKYSGTEEKPTDQRIWVTHDGSHVHED